MAKATPEERLAEPVVDDGLIGNLYAARDTSDTLAGIATRSDAGRRRFLAQRQVALATDVAARKDACEKGPGRRFGLVGKIVCRSQVGDDRPPS